LQVEPLPVREAWRLRTTVASTHLHWSLRATHGQLEHRVVFVGQSEREPLSPQGVAAGVAFLVGSGNLVEPLGALGARPNWEPRCSETETCAGAAHVAWLTEAVVVPIRSRVAVVQIGAEHGLPLAQTRPVAGRKWEASH
jgi:hypothetical protein